MRQNEILKGAKNLRLCPWHDSFRSLKEEDIKKGEKGLSSDVGWFRREITWFDLRNSTRKERRTVPSKESIYCPDLFYCWSKVVYNVNTFTFYICLSGFRVLWAFLRQNTLESVSHRKCNKDSIGVRCPVLPISCARFLDGGQ